MKARSANLVIIGGGGSGLAAALTAAEHGLDEITVVEKRQTLGGTSALAGGIFACESPVQERDKIIADKDDLFRKAMDWAHYDRVDPPLLRAFINQSGDTVRWLEAMGLEFKLIRHYPDQYPPVQHNPVGGGARLIEVLAQKSRAAGVDLRLQCAAERIVRDKSGGITGVVVQEGDEKVVYDTPQVIIATGGFPGNRELLKKYCLHWYDDMPVSGLPLQGDGLKLAADAGAALETFATMIKEGPRLHPYKWPLMTFERDPRTLWVNQEGRRFIDETAGHRVFESVNAMLMQPGAVSFALLDAGIAKAFEDKMPDVLAAMRTQASKNRVKIADNWADMARWIGCDPAILQDTVDRYNGYCRSGYDAQLAKKRRYLLPLQTPPFYAIKGHTVLLDTIGGIKINAAMEVLDTSGSAIPGLYAVGVTTSGWESTTYCSILSASAFGFAVNSGRIAGANAARASTTS